MTKTKAQKDATLARKSLVHWRKNLHMAKSKAWKDCEYDLSKTSCALCSKYYGKACFGCPLSGRNDCTLPGSPYWKIDELLSFENVPLKSTTQLQLVKAIERMIKALERIVKKGK